MTNITIKHMPIRQVQPREDNPRRHSLVQIKKIAASIKSFGFRFPVLMDGEGFLIAGHGRLAAAKRLGLERIPVICADDLSQDQARALMIADNRITDLSDWDDGLLAKHLDLLVAADLSFDIEDTGFDYGEIEVRSRNAARAVGGSEKNDAPELLTITARAQSGDLWALGDHRLICGDALDLAAYGDLLGDELATTVFTDPPYNLKPAEIGQIAQAHHGAFAMGSGEMSKAEFVAFLEAVFAQIRTHARAGATAYVCMDWRHLGEVQSAGDAVFCGLRNLCVWAKDRPGMGSLYRSQHELIFVWQVSDGKTSNHVQLGASGRNRSNIWDYPSASGFKAHEGELPNAVRYHPTIKPVQMIADALQDVSRTGEIVLDPFLGSGSTLIAAERMDRRCFGLEISPGYVDLVLARWEAETGRCAVCLNRNELESGTAAFGEPKPQQALGSA